MSKFKEGQFVRHLATGAVYRILLGPDRLFIEATNEPAYAYRRERVHPGPIWIRPQTEMEDEQRFSEINNG